MSRARRNQVTKVDRAADEEARLRALLDSIPDLIFFKDTASTYLGCNTAFAAYAGRAEQEIVGCSDLDLFDRETAEAFQHHDRAMLAHGRPRQNEERIRYPDGREVVLDTLKTPYYAPDGRVLGLIGIGRDITRRKQAERQAARQRDILEAVSRILSLYVSDEAPEAVFGTALEAVIRLTGSRHGYIAEARTDADGRPLVQALAVTSHCDDPGVQRFLSAHGADAFRFAAVSGLNAAPVRSGSPVICNAIGADVERRLPPEHPRLQCFLGLPLYSGGEVVGSLGLADREGGYDQEIVEELAPVLESCARIIDALRAERARRDAEARLRQWAVAFENAQEGVAIAGADGNIFKVNEGFSAITGYTAREVVGRNPRLLKSGRQDAAFYRSMWAALRERGSWKGEIWNRRKDGSEYAEWLSITAVRDAAGVIESYVGVFTDISPLKESEERLRHLAHHDDLTGLPNRALFQSRLQGALERARRNGGVGAVLYLDLDNFKHVNDSLGHSVGDALLQQAARMLQKLVRCDDLVARMGGDEFTLLVEDISGLEVAARIARKIIAAFSEPLRIDDQDIGVGASIGISVYPRDGATVEQLLQHADAAMYRAKNGGRNDFQFYTPQLTADSFERLTLTRELRRALKEDELSLYYQPQVDLRSGHVVGAEALLRWQHPEQGLVMPGRFIPLAEENGMIRPLGHWALREACRQARAWMDRGVELGRVAVNVAGSQLEGAGLADAVQQVLSDAGLPGERLELEITESFAMGHLGGILEQLRDVRAMGVRIAIDDFGTGYSSLAYLKQLPVDKLKVDRSFVDGLPADEDDRAITGAIIALARSLGLRVVAEGVETEAQREALLGLGCHEAQGFLFHRPLPAVAFAAMLGS